jgi:large subunit ribosomal protein L5
MPPRKRRAEGRARAGAEGAGAPAQAFRQVIREKLTQQFGYKNRMEVPRLDKIVLNMGVGEAVNDRKKVDTAAADLSMIAGRRP